MRARVVFLALIALSLLVSPALGIASAQENTTANETAANETVANESVAEAEPVDPYDEEYLNDSSTYGNNSSLGVHEMEEMRDSGGGMFYNALLDVFLTIFGFIIGGLATFIDTLLNTAIETVTFTPAPNWGTGYYQNPTNGVWPDRYAEWKNTVQPWTAFVTVMGTGIYIAFGKHGAGVLPARFERRGWWYILVAWFMTIFGWMYMAFILNFFNWMTMGIAMDVTEVTILHNALKGVMLIGLFAILVWNAWVFVVVISLVGFRTIGLTALAPWFPFFYALRSIPIQGLSMIGDGLSKLWHLLGLVALPVSIALTIGFSPMTTDILMENGVGNGIQLIAMQLGTSIACLVIPYFMYQKSGQALASVGVVGSAPTAESVKQTYQKQRERASELKQSTAQTAYGAMDLERGARGMQPASDGGTAYRVGSASREKVSTHTKTVQERIQSIRGDEGDSIIETEDDPWVGDTPGPNNTIDPETGADIQRGLERYQPDDPELEKLRQERLDEIRQRVSTIQDNQQKQ